MKKYVQVGCGVRGIYSYSKPLVKDYSEYGTLEGVFDINYKRAKLVSEVTGKEIPVFDNFAEMLQATKPDTVIVTSVDCTHDKYVIEALEFGCDVICEKPLTTTFEKCLAIKEAEKKSGKRVTVTFNLRFHPFYKELKKTVNTGMLGDILSVHYEWMLGMDHGSEYFHRWHSQREKSGSLLIHKSTHHFDVANWLLEQDPVSVNAYGTRRVFGTSHPAPAKRCLECKKRCQFYTNIMENGLKALYYDCEDVDGYLRDRCVFDSEVDIEDTVSVNVLYSGGTVMSYTLNAFAPYEGMRMSITGTKGRIEAYSRNRLIDVFLNDGKKIKIEVPNISNIDHGGADVCLRDNLFKGTVPEMPDQAADLRAGMMSAGIGMAANVSMKEERRVNIKEFYKEI